MRLVYDFRPEHYADFLYNQADSRYRLAWKVRGSAGCGILLALVHIVIGLLAGQSTSAVFSGGIAYGVLGFVLLLLALGGRHRHEVVAAHPDNVLLYGRQELELDGPVLLRRSQASECRTRSDSLRRVMVEGDYCAVHLAAALVIIIPRHAIIDGDPAAFIPELRRRMTEPGKTI